MCSAMLQYFCGLRASSRVLCLVQVKVRGLNGLQYFDNTDGVDDKPESGEVVSINGETDRIYRSAENTIVVSPPPPSPTRCILLWAAYLL